MDGLYTALAGLLGQRGLIEQAAGNIANANSPGYLAQQGQIYDTTTSFTARLAKTGPHWIGAMPSGIVNTNAVSLAPNPTVATGVPQNLAIAGNAFFAVKTPTGVAYTRDGAFFPDSQGTLAGPSGALLLDRQGQPITVAPGAYTVTAHGSVVQNGRALARIGLYQLAAPGIRSVGHNLYQGTAKPAPAGTASILQGSLNTANLSLVGAGVSLIEGQSAYQAQTAVINAESTRMQKAGQLGLLA